MTNLIAVLIGALISTVAAWSLKAREMRWQYHRVSLERLEEIAELAFIVAAYYDRRQKFWLQRLSGYDQTPAADLIVERRPSELDRMLALIPFHAPEMHSHLAALHSKSGVFTESALNMLAAQGYDQMFGKQKAESREQGAGAGAAPMNRFYAELERASEEIQALAWHIVSGAASCASARVRKQTRPVWSESKDLWHRLTARLRKRRAGEE